MNVVSCVKKYLLQEPFFNTKLAIEVLLQTMQNLILIINLGLKVDDAANGIIFLYAYSNKIIISNLTFYRNQTWYDLRNN